MKARYRFSFWDVAIGILAAMLIVTLAGGPRRLAPEWTVLQTWSMHWEGPDGKPVSTNFIYQTFKPRKDFGAFLHEYHWFGPPTVEIPLPSAMPVLGKMPVVPGMPASGTGHGRLIGRFVEGS